MSTFEDIPVTPRDVVDLFDEHQGKENAITSSEIAEQLGLDDKQVTNPATRELIRDTIEEEEIPVAAGSRGYYRIQDADELDEYLETLRGREVWIRHRRQLVAMAWNRQERADDA